MNNLMTFVACGGSWSNGSSVCEVIHHNHGFRVVRLKYHIGDSSFRFIIKQNE